MNEPAGKLRRELGISGAVVTGLGSILGTGVFVSIGIAAEVAGNGVVAAIVAAGVVAICNGLSSAQLAANHPVSGGTYEYGYRWLSPTLGFLAGWMFLCAKSASAATAALGFAGYVLRLAGSEQTGLLVPLALLAVILLTIVTLLGIRRTSQVNITIVATTCLSLSTFVVFGVGTHFDEVIRWERLVPEEGSWSAFAQATGLMFVAYTGYGRIATLGEEVQQPRRTIPLAVIVTLLISMGLYAAVALVAVQIVGAERLAELTRTSAAPLEAIAGEMGVPGLPLLLAVGAVTAMLGVLLNLLLGLSRVVLAMGRRGDLPTSFSAVHASSGVPWAATLLVAAIIAGIAAVGSVRLAWSFSAFTVLVYYAITNACALRLRPAERLYPVWIPVLGLVSCLSLALWVEREIAIAGGAVLLVGLGWHGIARRRFYAQPKQNEAN
ncbi:APC family permease [Blastopirellula marina]|uniref:Amino acid permease n=1 Tax=Blastopirellula marina TaxID=124 RepID=A0A2S8G9P0_9BACT|nr:APC family permease [Blastopirellula marina]PQO41139.1 amino acid permease [Blastopirellula marina]PTL46015.1 amino acid permease [Blastopirellula marina]